AARPRPGLAWRGSSPWRCAGCLAVARSRARAGPRPGSSRPAPSCRSEDLRQVRRPDPRAAPREPAADLQQARAVECGADPGAALLDPRALVGEHRARGVRVLDREGTAESAALRRIPELDQLQAA